MKKYTLIRQLNDILWFDSDWVLDNLGIEDDDNDELE